MDLPGFSTKNTRHLVGFELQINSEGLCSVCLKFKLTWASCALSRIPNGLET